MNHENNQTVNFYYDIIGKICDITEKRNEFVMVNVLGQDMMCKFVTTQTDYLEMIELVMKTHVGDVVLIKKVTHFDNIANPDMKYMDMETLKLCLNYENATKAMAKKLAAPKPNTKTVSASGQITIINHGTINIVGDQVK
jgi:hypothetical protein